MNISLELENALSSLEKSNLLSGTRAIGDFLRESAENNTLCSYVEKHAHYVVLRDELISLAKTKSFPKDPRICLPFAYSLLYLFDSKKLSPEDVVTEVFPKTDIDVAYTYFFVGMAKAISQSLRLADPETPTLEYENADYSEEPENAFKSFILFVSAVNPEEADEMISLTQSLETALESGDESLIKSLYYGLESVVKKSKTDLSSLDGIITEIKNKGVNI